MPIRRVARTLTRRALALPPWPQPAWAPTRYPVVLMHGFGALANLSSGGVLHREAMHLRTRGVAAFAPHVDPYGTIDMRAATWTRHLERVLAETGADRLNLVGFSTGGLDARLVACEPAWAGRVASLLTVSTPHRGSPLATWVRDRPDVLRGAIEGFLGWLGATAWRDAPPAAAAALAGLTPDAVVARFSPDELIPGAWCASFDAAAGAGTDVPMYPPLVVPNRILYGLAGLNDGIVPTASMAWGEPLGRLDADHARQIGMALTPSSRFRSLDFYAGIAERLRARGL